MSCRAPFQNHFSFLLTVHPLTPQCSDLSFICLAFQTQISFMLKEMNVLNCGTQQISETIRKIDLNGLTCYSPSLPFVGVECIIVLRTILLIIAFSLQETQPFLLFCFVGTFNSIPRMATPLTLVPASIRSDYFLAFKHWSRGRGYLQERKLHFENGVVVFRSAFSIQIRKWF